MMSFKNILISSSLLMFVIGFTSCNKPTTAGDPTPAPETVQQQQVVQPKPDFKKVSPAPSVKTLPVRYQSPSYMIGSDGSDDLFKTEAASSIKVGASIRSTRGPQPLWDILKRLAALKRMNVSWASDVDQKVLVDVDITANDDFYESIDNLLRQVDYFHEMEGNTIVVKYKDVRKFHIAMPFTKHNYSTGTGGNVLGGSGTSEDAAGDVDGTISLKSSDNEFDIWQNIQENMDLIIATWNTKAITADTETALAEGTVPDPGTAAAEEQVVTATRQVSSGGAMYIIDKPVGMVTVSAPRPLLDRLDTYFQSLKDELYKQIAIEAKIIEVQLNNSSSIGINWSQVLKAFPVSGTVEFGAGGEVYPSNARFVSRVTLDNADFSLFLNALKEEGDTKILSNPKISVMNGQPALITVGRNITYIDSIESEVDTDTNTTNYTVNTERILSGIGMALTATVLGDNQIIMNLVPVTSELEEPIEYRQIGDEGVEVGLPIVNVREMSTTVKVKDGEMLVIGGLISNVDDTEGEFAPILGDIPGLRYLFGYEEKVSQKRELIILLKPRII